MSNVELDFRKNIDEFFNDIKDNKEHRLVSWEYCYEYFQEKEFKGDSNKDYAALMLSFYLASWGMYRGSSELLKSYTYTIHIEAIELLHKYKNNLELCFIKLKEYYNNKNVSATDTLITKIIMGTLGKTPAYDRLFVAGLKYYNQINSTNFKYRFSIKSYEKLKNYFKNYIYKEICVENNGVIYPLEKLMDIYFWNIGRQIEYT